MMDNVTIYLSMQTMTAMQEFASLDVPQRNAVSTP
jgi:hypothetical protein